MKQARRIAQLAALTGVVVVGACRDSGLPERNLPIEEARHRQYSYAAYQPSADHTPLAAGGRHWIASLPVESIPDRMLAPVANADGTVLYAVRGRRAPYDRLYAPVGAGRWRPYTRLN